MLMIWFMNRSSICLANANIAWNAAIFRAKAGLIFEKFGLTFGRFFLVHRHRLPAARCPVVVGFPAIRRPAIP